MIKISIPKNNYFERCYIIEILFNEFLGLNFELLEDSACNSWKIKLNNGSNLLIEDHFFNKYPNELEYLHVDHIPLNVEHTTNPFTTEENIPVIYGNTTCNIQEQKIECGIDLFASCFFMLTRWEEYVNKTRDQYDRFPATVSLAYKHNFLDRPVVNEYVEMLKNMMLHLDNTLIFKSYYPKLMVSCDVDQPFDCTVESFYRYLRAGIGDLIKRKNIKEFAIRTKRYIFNQFGNYAYDENYTFNWYMDACEKVGIKATFYFIPNSHEANNGCYDLKDKKIQNLIKSIAKKGHEIGIHGSFQTYKDPHKIKMQKKYFEQILKALHVTQTISGNRQHYLRWDASGTPVHLDKAGFDYDTTGSYADSPGFRYGICYEFSMFDFLGRQQLALKQRPLIVMECSVIDESYMGLGSDTALKVMQDLKTKCYRYGGNFTLLWHNSYLKSEDDRRMFKAILHE